MFNGIIFNQGIVHNIRKRKNGINLFLKSKIKVFKKDLGISISCDGVCLTVISLNKSIIEFYLSDETLRKSKFRYIKIGDLVNLELPLKYGQKISGHICQGHVDTVTKIKSIKIVDKAKILEFKILKNFKKYLVEKGSILINGVSLTISKIKKNTFEVWIIPHTLKLTNLLYIKKNDFVNIEIDILAKYIKKFVYDKK
ncbi:MAG: riboflavin synthase [Candidatus Pelagibacter sp.]